MGFRDFNGLRYYQFDLFEDKLIDHGLFTRRGGVSPQPWASLNLGGTVGDIRENVIENRRRIFQSVDRQVESICDVWQVHSPTVMIAKRPRALEAAHEKADAILTNCPEITLFMRFADCVPILLHDPIQRVVGIVHAGWKGTVLKVVNNAVKEMINTFHSKPENILAGIGPSICFNHYEIGHDVANDFRNVFGSDSGEILLNDDHKIFLDLWKANRILLEQEGVKHIQISGVCTACHLEDWYSHRGEHGKTGRYGALIALKNL